MGAASGSQSTMGQEAELVREGGPHLNPARSASPLFSFSLPPRVTPLFSRVFFLPVLTFIQIYIGSLKSDLLALNPSPTLVP